MSEYIERSGIIGRITASEVQKAIREMDGNQVYGWVLMLLNAEPVADVAPVVHGQWVFDAESYEWNCSECHDCPIDGSADDERTYFCPHCGARMDL